MAKLRVDKIAAPIVKDEFTGSVYFDGTTQNRITIPSTTDFAPGTGDFTIEMFVYHTDLTGQQTYFGDTYGNTSGIYTYKTSNNEISLYDSAQRSLSAQNVIKLNTWHHIAWTRESGVLRAFVDGVIVDEDTYTGSFTDTDYFIGDTAGTSSGEMVGYISNLRYCKNHAVYTSNFTVPTRELEVHTGAKGVVFPAADNRTTLLACQSSTDATADATGRHTLTASSGVTAADANPGLFRRTLNLTTVTENTGSVFFDGNGDHLDLPLSDDFKFGALDFTIETWVYLVEAKDQAIFGTNLSSSNQGYELDVFTNGSIRFYSGNGSAYNYGALGLESSASVVPQQTWTHIVASRQGNTLRVFVNGVLSISNTSFSHTIADSSTTPDIGNDGRSTGTSYHLHGYLSNLRICKGHAVYTSNFAPPTRELEVHEGPDNDRTVLLACYDGEDIFADKTGRHIIATQGDRTSSPTPTVTDSPVGVTTHNPGLTRNVDPTAGPTFQGGAGYTSQNWLTLPKGTTTDRNRTGGRGLFGGGNPGSYSNAINYITISTSGNSQEFGDLTVARSRTSSYGSKTRGIWAGGNPVTNTIDFVHIATTGDAVNFGDLTVARRFSAGTSSSTRGISAGGNEAAGSPHASVNVIDYTTIATLGDAINFGDLLVTRSGLSALSSPTRALFAGGYDSGSPAAGTNDINYATIASTGNALDFGNLSAARRHLSGCSSNTRGVFGSGSAPGATNTIDYVTISTLGDAVDFGDATIANEHRAAMSNSIRGVWAGSGTPAAGNTIDYVTIASTGDASDFGDCASNTAYAGGCSDSHGGIS